MWDLGPRWTNTLFWKLKGQDIILPLCSLTCRIAVTSGHVDSEGSLPAEIISHCPLFKNNNTDLNSYIIRVWMPHVGTDVVTHHLDIEGEGGGGGLKQTLIRSLSKRLFSEENWKYQLFKSRLWSPAAGKSCDLSSVHQHQPPANIDFVALYTCHLTSSLISFYLRLVDNNIHRYMWYMQPATRGWLRCCIQTWEKFVPKPDQTLTIGKSKMNLTLN